MMQTQTTTQTATIKQVAFLAKLTGNDAQSFQSLTMREASILIGKTLKEQRQTAKKSKPATKKAKLAQTVEGVKVGDVFSMSWGYDCTINNSFEVVEIVSAHTVKVRELAHTPVDCWSPASGTEKFKKGDYLSRSSWSRNGKNPTKGADPKDENLFTKQIRTSPYHQGKKALYIVFSFGGGYNHQAYFDENPEQARYCSEY